MKRSLQFCVIVGTLAIAVSAMAAPIAFTENYEDDTAGVAPLSPWATDTHFANGSLLVMGAQGTYITPEGSNALRATNSTYVTGGSYGDQASVVGAGLAVEASDAATMALTYLTKLQHYRYTDFLVELSMGDVHAPVFTTVQQQTTTLPVIAIGRPYLEAILNTELGATVAPYGAETAQQVCFFDGKNWKTPGSSVASGTWVSGIALTVTAGTSGEAKNPEQVSMTIGSNSVTMDTSVHHDATDIAYTVAREYTGGFDRMTIYTRFATCGGKWTMLDSISLTGGNVVPEPATLLFLALGGVVMLRSRR